MLSTEIGIIEYDSNTKSIVCAATNSSYPGLGVLSYGASD